MKNLIRMIALLALFTGGTAAAQQQDLAGTWQGKLAIDANTSLTIQFVFTRKPDGSYAVVLNSPDNGAIKNVAASNVSWQAGTLKLDVAALSGAYAATLKDGRFDGKWTQPGSTIPLVLSPYQKPQLSKAAIDTLLGAWNGSLAIPSGALTLVTRFAANDKGELQGFLSVPEQGGMELPMSDIEFKDNKLAFKIARVQGEYSATYANGVFTGNWKQPSMPPGGAPVVLKKGDAAARVYALKLSSESFAALSGGTWKGKIGPLNLVLRFEVNANTQYVAFIDSPDQGVKGLPVTEASLTAGKLVVKVGAIGAEYAGDLASKTIVGQWTQGGKSQPLTFTKN